MICKFLYVESIKYEELIKQMKREAHAILAMVAHLNVPTPTTVSLPAEVRNKLT